MMRWHKKNKHEILYGWSKPEQLREKQKDDTKPRSLLSIYWRHQVIAPFITHLRTSYMYFLFIYHVRDVCECRMYMYRESWVYRWCHNIGRCFDDYYKILDLLFIVIDIVCFMLVPRRPFKGVSHQLLTANCFNIPKCYMGHVRCEINTYLSEEPQRKMKFILNNNRVCLFWHRMPQCRIPSVHRSHVKFLFRTEYVIRYCCSWFGF